jgi:exodeoxyribonuclease VII small subunit
MPETPQPVEAMNYEQAFAELETILFTLENEELPLEEAIQLYERGQELTRHCGALLDHAELRVRQLGSDDVQPSDEA